MTDVAGKSSQVPATLTPPVNSNVRFDVKFGQPSTFSAFQTGVS